MKRFLKILTAALAVILLFTACKQFLEDPEDFFSYWANAAFVKGHSIVSAHRPDGEGVQCVGSSGDAVIALRVHNPKGFLFVIPTSSEPADIVEFKELSEQPTAGTDYELKQTGSGTLQLIYKPALLQKYEQGSVGLNPTITLKTQDGRVFKQTYTFGIKSNTPPPKPKEIIIAKTKTDSHYVLCLQFDSAEMTKKVTIGSGTVPIHKDIAKITINDSSYTLLYKEDNSDFQKPAGDSFVEHGNVEKLTSSSPNLPSGAWVLYFNTGVKVESSNPQTSYTITLSDKEGVVSDSLTAELKEKFKVEFDAKGGSPVPAQYIENNGKVTRPTNPTKTGYIFGGWYTAPSYSTLWDFANNTVTGNITLYAKWTEAGDTPYKVEHYQQNITDDNYPSSPADTDRLSGMTGKLLSIGDGITLKDYPGFDYDHMNTTSPTITGDGNTVVRLYYNRKTYQVDFSVDGLGGTISATAVTGGTVNGSSVTVKHGGSVTFTGQPATGDWKVAGWTVSQGNFTSGGGTGETTATLSNVTADTTVTVKFYQSTLKNPATWRDLARAVKSAPDGAVITIDGEIKATDDEGNKGIINIEEGRKLTIKGNGSSAVLNANGKSSIFDVSDILTLENITLKKGVAFSNQSGGAGVYINSKGTLIMKGSSAITDCSAVNWGGGVYVSGTFEMHDTSAITGCTASKGGGVYVSNGTFKMQGSAIVTPSTSGDTDKPGKNDVYLEDGKTITVDSILLNAHAARITPELYKKQTVLQAGSGVTLKYEVGKFTVTPDGSDMWKIDSEGKLTLYEATIKGSPSSNDAWKKLKQAVANASDGSTIFIDGEVKATSGTGNNGEIVINKNLTIKRATGASSAVIDANKDTGSKPKHRIFKVESGKTLTLENLTLKGGKAEGTQDADNYGGAIYASGATVDITNCTLKGNEAVSGGGAIYARKEGSTASTITISGGTIGGTEEADKNKVTSDWQFGGGILVETGCTLTLNSVQIIGNEAWRAGGVRANRSTVTMTDCTIKNNKTTGDNDSGGGGVYTFMGRLTMTGCTITGNEAATNGGGLNVEGTTTNITNCTFTGNTAKNGGGIYTKKEEGTPPTVTISGGTIGGTDTDKANKATGTGSDGNGGGIYVGEDCKVTLQNNGSTGCTITGNTAQRGSGVYVNGRTFTMSGNTKIAVDNDVYLKTEKTITVDGTLSNNPAARITPEEYKENVPVLRGGSGVTLKNETGKFIVPPQKVTVESEDWNVFWYIADNGNLKAEVENSSLLQEVISGRPNNTPFIIKLGDIDDLTTVEIPKNKKIMLKADREVTLTCPSKGNDYKHLQVQENALLILEGQITLQGTDYGSGRSQYALYVEKYGEAEIKDGVTITGFKNADRGTVFADGNLTMSGGTITGNTANRGGGVYIAPNRSFTMKGGTIKGNTAGNGGGVYVDADGYYGMYGTFTMTGGTIEGNTADQGGGVFTYGSFTMSGGTITKNKANTDGKAVMIEHYSTWSGGEIKDNGGTGSSVLGPHASFYLDNPNNYTAT